MENSDAFIQLDPLDNVLVARYTLQKGECVTISGRIFQLNQQLPLGFKIANQKIEKGERLIKCGIPIGSASRDIKVGEMVHVHNMKSDYVPTYTIENKNKNER